MANPQHVEWLLEGVEAWNARQSNRQIGDDLPDLKHLDLVKLFSKTRRLGTSEHTELQGIDFSETNLRGANISSAYLQDSYFIDSEMRRANLQYANLSGATLNQAYLRESDMRFVDLSSSSLIGTNLHDCDLTGADLRGANLSGCMTLGTILTGANLEDANVSSPQNYWSQAAREIGGETPITDLSGTIGLTQDQVNSMFGDSGTILPDGLERPNHWPEFAPNQSVPSSPIGNRPFSSLDSPSANITPIVSVLWTKDGLDARFLLNVEDPKPRLFHPQEQLGASMDALSSLGQIAQQICKSLARDERPNFVSIAGEITGPFQAIFDEVHKPQGAVLSFVIDVNLRAIGTLFSKHSEALADVDRELVRSFLDLGKKWQNANAVLKEIEDPTNSDIVPIDKLDQIEAAAKEMTALITAEESAQYLGASLPGVTREMALYPWDTNDPERNRRMRAAAYGALAHEIWQAIKNPPEGVKSTVGFYAQLLAAAAAVLALFV